MSISASKRLIWKKFSLDESDRIVQMAWEDRTTFDSIQAQFGLSANEVVQFMRTQLDSKSYKRWRKRATLQGNLKHRLYIEHHDTRFKCSRQRLDGSTKGWK